jgi:hypothetical protein
VLVYGALFGTGAFIYGNSSVGGVCVVICVGSALGLAFLLAAMWRSRRLAE